MTSLRDRFFAADVGKRYRVRPAVRTVVAVNDLFCWMQERAGDVVTLVEAEDGDYQGLVEDGDGRRGHVYRIWMEEI